MNRLANPLGVCLMGTLMGLLMVTAGARAQQIRGDYIESRNADVYTGHCYAMSELNLVGRSGDRRLARGEGGVGWRASSTG
jgi:hypothetical protein